MIEIEISGFQSLERVSLKVDGFTAVTGRTNIGKSSIVRALKVALSNSLGTAFVRHGDACLRRTKGLKTCKCEAYVHLSAPNFDLVWRKGDAVNMYMLNGKPMTVPGRGFPDFLNPLFAPVKMGDAQKMIQIADQFYPLFLLDEPGSTVANLLSDVARLDAINVAMKMVEKDRREATSLRKVREKDVEVLRSDLRHYDGIDATLRSAKHITDGYGDIQKAEHRVAAASLLTTHLAAIVAQFRALDGIDGVVVPEYAGLREASIRCVGAIGLHDRLVEGARAYKALEGCVKIAVPDPATIRATLATQRRVAELVTLYEDRRTVVDALGGVGDLYIPDITSLRGMLLRWSEAQGLHGRLVDRVLASKGLEGVDQIEIPDSTGLGVSGKAVTHITVLSDRLQTLTSWLDDRVSVDNTVVPDTTPLVEGVKSLRTITDLVRRHDTLGTSIKMIESACEGIERELAEAEEDRSRFLDDVRALGLLCPSCEQPLQDHQHKEGADEHPTVSI